VGKILQGRYDRLLRRTTAQVGFGSKVNEALEDLFPTLDVEQAPMELLRASGWRFGMGLAAAAAAVGTTNSQQLFNPAGSGLLMVLTRVIITPDTAGVIEFGPSFTALTDASVAGVERDTRAGQIEATVGLLQQQDDGTSSAFGVIRGLANTPTFFDDPNGLAVLAPGSGFRITQLTTGITLRTSYFWRERVAEPEELDF